MSRLELCAQIFDFVEINSSFYSLPNLKQAQKWRASVPKNFEFTLRANRKLTHESHLEPTEDNFRKFRETVEICWALEAGVLHFQFPPSFPVTREVVSNWTDFFKSVNKPRELHCAFEIRNSETAEAGYLGNFLADFDIIPTTDISRNQKPETSARSKILYSRIFGAGEKTKWSFSTDELLNLKEKVEKVVPASRKYVTFHNITMYEDGARLKHIIKEGNDVLPKREIGVDSLKRAMIAARVHFPVTKEGLMREMAWRTIDVGKDASIHADRILKDLPEHTFSSMSEVLEKISGKIGSASNAAALA
jgi:uncharacterized protein YecE (DUF72 family)